MAAVEIPLRSFSITLGSRGDFNELRNFFEKEGGRPRPGLQMDSFNDFIRWCGFNEVG